MPVNPFLEEVLPIGVRYGAEWQTDFAVEVNVTASGTEYRSMNHPFPSYRFTVEYRDERADLYNEIVAMYHRTFGKYKGFRVLAFDDCSTNGKDGAPTAFDQALLRVSAGVYQLQKQYGGTGAVRRIFKPQGGTTKVAVGGAEIMSGWTVDTTTGLVTISPDPGGGAVVRGGCKFHIPCRFDSKLSVQPISPVYADTSEIAIIELVNP